MAVERIVSEDLLVQPQGYGGVILKFKTPPVGEKGAKGDAGTTGGVGAKGDTGSAGDETLIYLAL